MARGRSVGRMRRQKGKEGEREVAKILREAGFEARRGQQYSGTETSADIVHNMGNFHPEVKRDERTASVALYKAVEQANSDRAADHFPVVFTRRNGSPWLAVMYMEDWMQFIDREDVLPDAEKKDD